MAICAGKDCRNHEAYGALCDAVGGEGVVLQIKCLDHCRSPVVVLDPETDAPIVLERVRSGKKRRALVGLLRSGAPLPEPLVKSQVTGKPRKKALTRLRRQVRS